MIFTKNQEKAKEYSSHLSVEANAGSGKTAVLVERFVNILLNSQKIKIHNVLGITFTEKAANELKNRIFIKLAEIILSETGYEKNRAKLILERMSSLQIGTIHGFCANILKEFPNEADLDSNFSILDGIDQSILIENSIDETMRAILENKNISPEKEDLDYLLRMYGTRKVKENLKHFLFKREKIIILDETIYSKTNKEIIAYWLETLSSFTEKVIDYSNLTKNLLKYKNLDPKIQSILEKYKHSNELHEKCKLFKDLYSLIYTKEGKLLKKFLRSNEDAFELIDDLISSSKKISYLNDFFEFLNYFSAAVPDTEEIDFQIDITRKYFSVFKKISGHYKHLKDLNAQLDFDDLILKVRELLNNEDIRKVLNERILYIMVDEYQDTNLFQFQILDILTDHLSKANLYIVGDPKQSIYGFRDAEVKIFDSTTKMIEEKNSQISSSDPVPEAGSKSGKEGKIILNESFRLLSDIVVFTNFLFDRIMQKNVLEDLEYKTLVKARNNDYPGKVEFLFTTDEKSDEEEMIAKKILNIINSKQLVYETKSEISRTAQFGDFAILLRSRNNLKKLENVFVRNNIPFIVSGGIGYYQTQEIYDVYNYLKFLLNNKDDVALVGILRSPFFLVPDSDLYKIVQEPDYNLSFWEKLIIYSERHDPGKKLKRNIQILQDDLAYAKRISIPILINRIVSRTYWIGITSGKDNGDQSLANLDKFLNIARDFENKGFNTLFDFLERLKVLITQEEKEGQAVIDPTNQMVKVLTIHAAKGLEFPIVFIPYTDRTFRGDSEPYINTEYGLGFEIPNKDNYEEERKKTIITFFLKTINKLKIDSEEKRILYVAITRAHNHLIISGKYDYKSQKIGYLNWIRDAFDLDDNILVKDEDGEMEDEKNSKDKATYSLKSADMTFNYPLQISEINENKFSEKTIPEYHLNIQVTTSTEEIPTIPEASILSESSYQKPEIFIDPIPAGIVGNYISATLFQAYRQCPVQYFIRYSLGLPEESLPEKKRYIKKNKTDDNSLGFSFIQDSVNIGVNEFEKIEYPNADPEIFLEYDSPYVLPGQIKGKILHKVMESIDKIDKNISVLDSILDTALNIYFNLHNKDLDKIKNGMKKYIVNFLKSKAWKNISMYKKYHCEFELQAAFESDFLIGTMDRICIGDDILIIDYKTNKVSLENINKANESYFDQMAFYAFLTKILYPEKQIKSMLVFMENPDLSREIVYTSENFIEIKNVLNKTIEEIKIVEYDPKRLKKNKSHCMFCDYYIDKNCIMR